MNDTPEQQEKLRSILRNDMEKTLGQIQNLISGAPSPEASVEFEKLVSSVIRRYPFDAKPLIVAMLKKAGRTFDEYNDDFIKAATLAFQSPPV